MTNLDEYTIDQRREAINQVIISKRDRRVLELRFLDGMSYKEIGVDPQVCLEVRRVGVILNCGSAKIDAYLKNR